MANIGIVVSGGPAPGINTLVASIGFAAKNRGIGVKGFQGGFLGMSSNPHDEVIDLDIGISSNLFQQGGSLLGTSRFNPLQDSATEERLISCLRKNNVDKLAVIGGEGSAYVSYHLSKKYKDIQIVHLPKTIDNDLPLPNNQPSFGYDSARFAGTRFVNTLVVDARTIRKRWFFVTCMGRKAGFLALGIGLSSGAALTVIPEEFKEDLVPLNRVADLVFNSIKARYKNDKSYGVAVLAEGLIDKIDPATCEALQKAPKDELGRVRYHLVEIGEVLAPVLRERCLREGIDIRITGVSTGYELRCHAPIASDVEYTKYLGVGAVDALLKGQTGVMIVRDYDNLGTVNLDDIANKDGHINARRVDLDSDLYKVARSFMVR